jgi:hypothetical protein
MHLMRVIGSRVQYRISAMPSGAALAAVPTTGVRRRIHRFATRELANAHSDQAQARAIARNLRARKLVP